MMKWRETAQKIQVKLAPAKISSKSSHPAIVAQVRKQQHLSQRIRDPPWLPSIRKLRKMLEENGHSMRNRSMRNRSMRNRSMRNRSMRNN
jgi:hypothetical protein